MKKLISLLSILMAACLFAGCTTAKSYTYSVETGDSVKVELDTTGGYNITSDVPFVISKDGKDLSQGTFIFSNAYEDYVDEVSEQVGVTLLDSGEKDGMEYIFWSYNDTEFNFAILLDGSDTGIVLGNNISEESARECFDRLGFEVTE